MFGVDVFSAFSSNSVARERIVTSEQVIEASPDIIIASWCGKKVSHDTFEDRDGWSAEPAVRNNFRYEI